MSKLVCVNDYAEEAKEKLPKPYYEFFFGGCSEENTLKWNKSAYEKFRIRPRYMRKVSKRTTTATILGKPTSIPVGISPTALHKLAHHEGEKATARAAQESETIFVLSSHATCTIEEVFEAAPTGRKWLQMYILKSREVTVDLVKRAEACGFEALVLTVDFPVVGIRWRLKRNQFQLPHNLDLAIFAKYKNYDQLKSVIEFCDQDVDWEYISWLKSITKLPIIAKGILTAEDALLAVEAGVSGILVSNHGARQLDGVPSTLEALPEVVRAVGDKVEVYMDGGIKSGNDIFKALALGAKMVFIGRSTIWGLACDGENGVKDILAMLRYELDNVMAISGCCKLADVNKEMVVHESYYSKL